MTLKQQLHKLVETLPESRDDGATLEELQYRLYVLDKIRRGEESLNNGEGISDADVRARFEKWLKN